jgi:hypothetical protein
VIVADDDLFSGLLPRGKNTLDAARRQRQRALAQHVHLGFERA